MHGRGDRGEVQDIALVRLLRKADDLGVKLRGLLAGLFLQRRRMILLCRARGLAEIIKAWPEANPVTVAGCFWLSKCFPTSLTK